MSISVSKLIRSIRKLPEDAPVDDTKKWYRTQKEHWLGWLAEYDTKGAYGRNTSVERDARYAYNHIVEPKMLLWLIEAAGIDAALVRQAKRKTTHGSTMMQQSAAVRRLVPWEMMERQLWAPSRIDQPSNSEGTED